MRIEAKQLLYITSMQNMAFGTSKILSSQIKTNTFLQILQYLLFGLEIQGIFRLVHPGTCWSKCIKH